MIKKIIILFIMLLFSFALAEEETVLSAGIKYNEATARIAAFKDLPAKIERKKFKEYLKDPNKKENLKAIAEEKYHVDSRELCPFFYKNTLVTYAVSYDDMPYMVFYYSIFGSLTKFDIIEINNNTERTIGYSKYGNLINVSFSADTEEQFVYNAKGKLIAHWLGDEMVDKKFGIKIVRKSKDSESQEKKED